MFYAINGYFIFLAILKLHLKEDKTRCYRIVKQISTDNGTTWRYMVVFVTPRIIDLTCQLW